MLGPEVRRAFEGHRAAAIGVGGVDLGAREAECGEQVEPGIATSNSRALVLAAPTDDPAEVRRLLDTGVFVGIKPYRLYADVPDTNEATIESFAPEWMWELCDEHDGVLMLHIIRAGGITDPHNIESIRRLCRRYPRCRLVLAHVAGPAVLAQALHRRVGDRLDHRADPARMLLQPWLDRFVQRGLQKALAIAREENPEFTTPQPTAERARSAV